MCNSASAFSTFDGPRDDASLRGDLDKALKERDQLRTELGQTKINLEGVRRERLTCEAPLKERCITLSHDVLEPMLQHKRLSTNFLRTIFALFHVI